MSDTKLRSQPSHYPFFAFHFTRTCSLVCSTIVSAILLYFCYWLKHDNYKIPWTFLVLLAVSLLTLITLATTFLIHVCSTLSPRINLIINIPLLVLWLAGMGLLGWNMTGTLFHSCTISNWGNDTGIMICNIYKTLFAFTVIASASCIANVVIDIKVRKEQVRQGSYEKMEARLHHAPSTASQPEDLKFAGMHNVGDIAPEPYRNQGHEPAYQDLRPRNGHQAYSSQDYSMQQFGYNAPSEQTKYDPGSYGYGDRR